MKKLEDVLKKLNKYFLKKSIISNKIQTHWI
ncbi:Uncharacterised protein [Mycoplasmopsis citelli]|uniref:Uncharacterized protein n=1 Tax=Mycoplasmopsis citelli TaxID=171281 RepID=A0A449B2I5_9BACT|nr:Uncharacterised protein [Mycoplasmopsis citelli]